MTQPKFRWSGREIAWVSIWTFGTAAAHLGIRSLDDNLKACPHCGAHYSDDSVTCVDGYLLGAPAESRGEFGNVGVPRFRCPACGAADDYTPTVELRSAFSWPVFLVGGFLAVLFRNAGRRRKVRCNKCEKLFDIRTPLSRVSLVIFWLLISPTILVLVIWLLALLGSIFSH